MHRMMALMICTIVMVSGPDSLIAQAKLAGDWEGAISIGAMDLGMIVHFAGTDDSLKATIDIPMQMARGLVLTNVRASLPVVHFELPAGPGLAVFEGLAAGDSIAGDFRQGSVTAKFHLRRAGMQKDAAAAPPPPYREEEVRVPNGEIVLAGTLTLPEKGGPFAAAILITGSGAQNRDEEIFGFTPFRILADHLTRNGYAVLRCDDRGVGGSTGSMSVSTTADFSNDVLAMLRFLRSRTDIKSSRIGLIGHSEGAAVAAMAASKSAEPAFVILLAGPGIRGDSVILSQIQTLGRGQGESEEVIQNGLAVQRRVFATVRAQKGWDDLRVELMREMRRSMDRMTAEQKAAMPNPDSLLGARLDIQMNALRTPWFAFFISYDPVDDLAGIRCPVLALFGELDQQVAVALNMEPLKAALARNGNPDVTIAIIPGANHLFQKAVTGSPAEYAGLEKRFADGVFDRLTLWLKQRVP